jgi:hypothetical protein
MRRRCWLPAADQLSNRRPFLTKPQGYSALFPVTWRLGVLSVVDKMKFKTAAILGITPLDEMQESYGGHFHGEYLTMSR